MSAEKIDEAAAKYPEEGSASVVAAEDATMTTMSPQIQPSAADAGRKNDAAEDEGATGSEEEGDGIEDTMARKTVQTSNVKGTVDGGYDDVKAYISPEEKKELSPPRNKNVVIDATTPPRHPPVPARPIHSSAPSAHSSSGKPTHTSAPSMVFPNKPGVIQAHNRSVTPHTESLMSLFAKPASTPLTPAVPEKKEYGTLNNLHLSVDVAPAPPPLMPGFFDRPSPKNEDTTPRSANSAEKVAKAQNVVEKDGGELPMIPRPSMMQREITPTTQNLRADANANKSFRRQQTPTTHNRDETIVAHNLRRKPQPYDEDLRHSDATERTGLMRSCRGSWKSQEFDIVPLQKGGLGRFLDATKSSCDSESLKPTFIGAFLFSLYQLVFCFAEASAITRPSRRGAAASALLSPMALTACMGSLVSGPMLIAVLGGDYPALYPCLDMFMAPFLAQMAADIDEVLAETNGDSEDDTGMFLATFVALNAAGMLMSGLLCVLAGKVKLANLAGFLPYPVLCGFFSSVGISVWMSAFKVDTGITIQRALSSGSWRSLLINFARHAPSFVVGAALYVLGPRGPHFLLGIIAASIAFAYLAMILAGETLEEAQEMSFFWKPEEVSMSDGDKQFAYGPPAAFGLWSPSVLKMVCWPAFMNGLSGVIAMSVIYLLRCSLHAAALNKCAAKMKSSDATEAHPLSSTNGDQSAHKMEQGNGHKIHPKKARPKDLMMWYANALFAVAFSGGFAVLPAIALGGIFSKIGAVTRSPQYIAMIILLGCYLSDFWLCSYVPKYTFSSLLVLAAIDLIHSWFVKSYQKSATEWIVVPFIVVTSLAYGMLQSVGLGLAASTLIFVASFFRAGVVKFIANGLTIRSTVERNIEDNQWLDQHADLIQILVLQNYLFFGNANSCLKYIQTMFDDEGGHDEDLPPIPKYVILDLSIVTGIDTSAVDVVADISSLCRDNKCNLILAGIPRVIRPALMKGGVKPSMTNKHLTFSPDLEMALGRAEDELLKVVGHNEEKITKVGDELRHKRRISMVDHGLRHALREIDTQHNLALATHLTLLEKYTTPIEINAGDKLNDVGNEHNLPRGLYFIEAGLLRCEHDSSASLTRGRTRSNFFATPHMDSNDSIGHIRARTATIGRCANMLKQNPGAMMAQNHTFRLARIGPGWVIGTISDFIGQDILGTFTALTPCRVHHLTFETIEELEVEKPVLILHLYKLLSHLSARRQEMTIGQLATLRSIMSATAPTKPISRRKMKAINQSF